MATQLVPIRQSNCSLYEVEDNLQALVNSIDLAEEPSSHDAIFEEIGEALRKDPGETGSEMKAPETLRPFLLPR